MEVSTIHNSQESEQAKGYFQQFFVCSTPGEADRLAAAHRTGRTSARIYHRTVKADNRIADVFCVIVRAKRTKATA